MIAIHLCDICHSESNISVHQWLYTFIISQYFKVLILKVYRKRVLLIPLNPNLNNIQTQTHHMKYLTSCKRLQLWYSQ